MKANQIKLTSLNFHLASCSTLSKEILNIKRAFWDLQGYCKISPGFITWTSSVSAWPILIGECDPFLICKQNANFFSVFIHMDLMVFTHSLAKWPYLAMICFECNWISLWGPLLVKTKWACDWSLKGNKRWCLARKRKSTKVIWTWDLNRTFISLRTSSLSQSSMPTLVESRLITAISWSFSLDSFFRLEQWLTKLMLKDPMLVETCDWKKILHYVSLCFKKVKFVVTFTLGVKLVLKYESTRTTDTKDLAWNVNLLAVGSSSSSKTLSCTIILHMSETAIFFLSDSIGRSKCLQN